MPERLYSTQQVASLLGSTPTTVTDWIQRGWLPSQRLPDGSQRVSESGLVRFLKDRGVNLAEVMARSILDDLAEPTPEGPSPAAEATPPPPATPRRSEAGPPLPRVAWVEPAPPARTAVAGDPPEPPAPRTAAEPPTPRAAAEPDAPEPRPDIPAAEREPEAPVRPPSPDHRPAGGPEAPPLRPAAPADGTAAQLAEAILDDAVRRRAGAIHLEPQPDGLALRIRIDGMLHQKPSFKERLPQGAEAGLVARLKARAGLDVSECSRPQAGRFRERFEGRDVEFRLATYPTICGEKVVLRILDHGAPLPTLDTLGFSADDLAAVGHALAERSGLVVVIGPPRTSRRTTLRAMIAALSSPERSIVAIEDSIDVEIPEVAHTQVDRGTPNAYAEAVRALAGQDADIVMVGEIRDRETARAAVDAAAAGCLVLAAMPGRSETPDPTVLLAAGVEPMALATTLLAFIVQRSARRLCDHCKVTAAPNAGLLRALGYTGEVGALAVYKARGCPRCSSIGYAGRVGFFSVLRADERTSRLILAGADERAWAEALARGVRQDLRGAALDKVRRGVTSLEEAARVLGLR